MTRSDELVILSFMIASSSTLYGYHGLTEPEILSHFGDSGALWVSYTGPSPLLRCTDRLAHVRWLHDNRHPAFSCALRCLVHRAMIGLVSSHICYQLLGVPEWQVTKPPKQGWPGLVR